MECKVIMRAEGGRSKLRLEGLTNKLVYEQYPMIPVHKDSINIFIVNKEPITKDDGYKAIASVKAMDFDGGALLVLSNESILGLRDYYNKYGILPSSVTIETRTLYDTELLRDLNGPMKGDRVRGLCPNTNDFSKFKRWFIDHYDLDNSIYAINSGSTRKLFKQTFKTVEVEKIVVNDLGTVDITIPNNIDALIKEKAREYAGFKEGVDPESEDEQYYQKHKVEVYKAFIEGAKYIANK